LHVSFSAPYAVRETVALLTNPALAREGIKVAVDHRTLEAQGFSRDPARYEAGDEAGEQRTQDYRQRLHESGVTTFERWVTHLLWQDQASTLPSLDRETIREVGRDRVWGEAPSMASLLAALTREPTTHTREQQDHTQAQRAAERPTQAWAQDAGGEGVADALEALAQRLNALGETEDSDGHGRVRLWNRETDRRRDTGLSW
jgi:hypothetical protein